MLFRLVPYLVDYKTQNTIYFATKSKLASIALITICKVILWLSNLLSNRLRSYKLLKLWDYALKLEKSAWSGRRTRLIACLIKARVCLVRRGVTTPWLWLAPVLARHHFKSQYCTCGKWEYNVIGPNYNLGDWGIKWNKTKNSSSYVYESMHAVSIYIWITKSSYHLLYETYKPSPLE